MSIHRPEKHRDDALLCLDHNGKKITNKIYTMSIQKHKINDKTDIGNPQCFCPSVLPHTYMHTHIPSSISQYIAVVVSTAGNIWRHFESVYISKTLKNTAGARRVIRNQVTKKDCLNTNNSRLCLSLSPPGTCSLSTHFSSIAHHLPFNEK